MRREYVIGLCRIVDAGERQLKAAKRRHQEALEALRQSCRHPTAVEISRTWTEALGDTEKPRASAWRFCLECGESEHGSSYVLGATAPHFQFRFLEKSRIARREAFKSNEDYGALLEVFRDRLHEKGRFDEFDAKGVWRGRDEIVRGED
jgi:hypothetical protein